MIGLLISSKVVKLVTLPLFFLQLHAQSNYWVHTNDGPWGHINSFTFVGASVFTCGAGIFRSTNQGQFWYRLNYEFDFRNVNCMVVDSNGNMYTGTGNGLYFSSDEGVSWTKKDSNLAGKSVEALIVSPGGDLFAGTSGPTIFKSSDKGNSWQKVGSFLNGISVSSFLITEAGAILAGVTGATWIEKTHSNYDSIRVGGIYRSTDGGTSWHTSYLGIIYDTWGNHSYQLITSLCKNDSGRLYAGVSNLWSFDHGTVLVSVDDGKSWTPTSFQLPVAGLGVGSSGFVFAGTPFNGIYRSSNNGSQWQQVSNTNVTALAVDEDGKVWVATSYLGGLMCSSNDGNNWQSPSGGLRNPNVSSLAFNSQGTLFAGTSQGGGIPYTTDGGNSWSRSDQISSDWVNAIVVDESDYVYASGSYTFYRSTDDGHTWDTVGFPSLNLPVYSFCLDGSNGILAASFHGIFHSTTHGSSWEPLLENTLINYSIIRDPVGWIYAGSDSGVMRSTNNGASWDKVNNGLSNTSVRAMTSTSDGKIFAGTWGGGIFCSTDRGNLWIECNSGILATYVQSFAVNPIGHIFVGISGCGVYRSRDAGSTWEAINSGFTFINNTRALAISTEGYIFAGTFARGVFRSAESTTSVGEILSQTPSNFELLQNYPNPFNPNTTIRYLLPKKTHIILKVFDIIGREIAKIVDEVEGPGYKSIPFDATGLSSGIYFYRLQTDSYSQTRKLVLLK